MSEPYLVSFDTDRIKDYMFATDKLREVRGASYLLTTLNKPLREDEPLTEAEIRAVAPAYRSVFFGGGACAVLVPGETDAQKVKTAVEDLYRRRTYTASITGVVLPLAPATETTGFGERMALAGIRLREAKDSKAERWLPGIEPYTQPCAACERHPAVRVSAVDQTAVCESCHAKREAFEEYRRKVDPNAPDDLNALGDVARPPGYIGFILADGNRMGERLSDCGSVAQYKTFAVGLDRLVRKTAADALEKFPVRSRGEAEIRPHEQLLVGGDDLMLIVAGDLALPAALDLATTFQQDSIGLLAEAGLPGEKPLTLGVAVVLAHASFPMAAFYRLADQLLKRAKQRCAEIHYADSAVDFMVVTAAGSSDLSVLREEVLTQKSFAFWHGDRKIHLTQRPYRLEEARLLLERLMDFKRAAFPRSQLQYLYEGLFHSQVEATYRWGKVAGRVGSEARQPLEAFDRAFGDGGAGLPPWRSRRGDEAANYTSALGDLVEIYPFVQA